MLSDNEPSIRLDAARQLGLLRTQEAVPYLIKLLADEDIDVVEEVGAALGKIGDRSARGPMVATYTRNQEYLSEDFAEAIIMLGGITDIERLKRDSMYWKPVGQKQEPEWYFSTQDILRHMKDAICRSRSVKLEYNPPEGSKMIITLTPERVFRSRKGHLHVKGFCMEHNDTFYLRISRILRLRT